MKKPIIIGTVGTQSGLAAAANYAGVQAVQTWVASVNAAGGLKCHPVKYLVRDDGGDPSRNHAQVKELVERQGVIAFVYMDSSLAGGQSSVDYITKARVPVVGTDSSSLGAYQSPMYFPQMIQNHLLARSLMQVAARAGKSQGQTKVGLITCLEAPVCGQQNEVGPGYARKYGLTVVYNTRVTLTAPDYTAQCQAARNAGAQVLVLGIDGASTQRLARSCGTVNYHPKYDLPDAGTNPSFPSDPNVDGIILASYVIPWFWTSNNEVAAFQDVMRRYGPGVVIKASTMEGWIAAKLFELAAQNVSDNPASGDILNGLWSIKGNDFGGMTLPLTFVKNKPAPETFCAWFIQLKSGQYVSPDNAKRDCS